MNVLIIILYIILSILGGLTLFFDLYTIFSKSKRKKIICFILSALFIIASITTQIYNNIKKDTVIIEENKGSNEYQYDYDTDNIIVSEDYDGIPTIKDNLGEDYYNDLQTSKNERSRIVLNISIVSFLVIFAVIFLYPKIYFEKKMGSIIAGIVIIGIYDFISLFGILPLEVPIKTSITIPIYKNVTQTHLVDSTHYKTTTTPILIDEVKLIEYIDSKIIRPYKSIVYLTDLCIVLLVILNISSEEKSFVELIKQTFIYIKNNIQNSHKHHMKVP